MSFHRTVGGEIWGSAAQQRSVQKAAEASARKRRKSHPNVDGLRQMHTADAARLRGKRPAPPQADGQDRLRKLQNGDANRLKAKATAPTKPHFKPLAPGEAAEFQRRRDTREKSGTGFNHTGSAETQYHHRHPGFAKTAEPPHPGSFAGKSDVEKIQGRIEHLKWRQKNPDYTGLATASLRQTYDERITQQIRYAQKQLRRAKHAEESRADAEKLAARTPEQKAADEVQQGINGRAAQVRDLRKKIDTLPPESWAAKDAREKLQGLLMSERMTRDEVIANAQWYAAGTYENALNAATRRARVAAGGPGEIPKGKILKPDGTLRDAAPKSSDILQNGVVYTPAEAAALKRGIPHDIIMAKRELQEGLKAEKIEKAAAAKERAKNRPPKFSGKSRVGDTPDPKLGEYIGKLERARDPESPAAADQYLTLLRRTQAVQADQGHDAAQAGYDSLRDFRERRMKAGLSPHPMRSSELTHELMQERIGERRGVTWEMHKHTGAERPEDRGDQDPLTNYFTDAELRAYGRDPDEIRAKAARAQAEMDQIRAQQKAARALRAVGEGPQLGNAPDIVVKNAAGVETARYPDFQPGTPLTTPKLRGDVEISRATRHPEYVRVRHIDSNTFVDVDRRTLAIAPEKPAGYDEAKAKSDAHNQALAAYEAEHGEANRRRRSEAAKRAAETRKANAEGGIPAGVNMNSEHNQLAMLMGAGRPKKSRISADLPKQSPEITVAPQLANQARETQANVDEARRLREEFSNRPKSPRPKSYNDRSGREGYGPDHPEYGKGYQPDKWKTGKQARETEQIAADAGWQPYDYGSGRRNQVYRQGDVEAVIDYSDTGQIRSATFRDTATRKTLALVGNNQKAKAAIVEKFLRTLVRGAVPA